MGILRAHSVRIAAKKLSGIHNVLRAGACVARMHTDTRGIFMSHIPRSILGTGDRRRISRSRHYPAQSADATLRGKAPPIQPSLPRNVATGATRRTSI
jgi:hypothetical protein